MMYAAEPTPFMAWARDSAAERSVDGTGMLVEQAAEAFYLWRGVRPRDQGGDQRAARTTRGIPIGPAESGKLSLRQADRRIEFIQSVSLCT